MTDYAFSATRGWLDNLHTTKGATTHQDLTYARYSDGMISGITSAKSMESWLYVYDDLNRLLSATNVDTPGLTQSFTYDDVGNMTYNSQIGSYTYRTPGTGQPHAVQTAGSRSYVYDTVGRMTSRDGALLQWNGDGKPSSIGSVAFTYGGTGERLKKVSGSDVTRYVGGNYEIAPDGTVTKYLIGGKQVDTNFFINHSDHLASIQAVTDAAGVEVRRQAHTPFGDQHYATGSHAESKGWIGEREEETELVYLNARYYDPEIGRFTSPDPIARLGQGLNRYSYALNTGPSIKPPCVACSQALLWGHGERSSRKGQSWKIPQRQVKSKLPTTAPLISISNVLITPAAVKSSIVNSQRELVAAASPVPTKVSVRSSPVTK